MKYSVTLLFLALIAAGCAAQAQDHTVLQSKCAAGDQPSCTALAQAQSAQDLQQMMSPIPSPATAIGGVSH